jgi:tRNA (cmo5U34)-methyltransferase
MAHHSVPRGDEERLRWLSRSVAFAAPIDRQPDPSSASAMPERLPLLSPEEDEALLREAGFSDTALFYAAFSFRGWVALA